MRKALTRRRDVVLSSLGSFSTAYNIVVIRCVSYLCRRIIVCLRVDNGVTDTEAGILFALNAHHTHAKTNHSLAMVSMSEVYAQSEESKSLSASTMFAGMVCGQVRR